MILACQLIKAFVGTTNFNHNVTIYAEISTLVASILHMVSCRSQLIGKECFTRRTPLQARVGNLSFLAEPVFRQAVHHAVPEAEAEVVHRLAQYGWRGPLGIEVGIAAGES